MGGPVVPEEGNESKRVQSESLSILPPTKLPAKWRLVLPSISIGNDAQLAIDLLLSSLPFEHLGHLPTRDVLPFVAASPLVPSHRSQLITGLEVYLLPDPGMDIILLQQRSPSSKGRAACFAHAVTKWALVNGCVEIVLLSSAHAAGAQGRLMQSFVNGMGVWDRFRIAATTAALKPKSARSSAIHMGMLPLENVDGDPRGWSSTLRSNVELDLMQAEESIPRFLPSSRKGSFVRTALEKCEENGLALTLLVHFVHEGDNAGDATTLASATAMVLNLATVKQARSAGSITDAVEQLNVHWKMPPSWMDSEEVPHGLY